MDNPETLATLSIQDTGPENKNEKKQKQILILYPIKKYLISVIVVDI
jgi:hypothetical protein